VTDPTSLHERALKLHESHTGQWVLRSDSWKRWFHGDERFLWIHGIPGSGKTVLASYLIQEIQSACEKKPDAVCVFYYCFYGHHQNETFPFYRWLVAELCRQTEYIPQTLLDQFRGYRSTSSFQLEMALQILLERVEVAYVVVDAVDESKGRDEILTLLGSLGMGDRFDNIKLLVTSREYLDIEEEFSDISISQPMVNPLVTEDIGSYVHSALHTTRAFRRWPKPLLIEVENALTNGAKGMYVLICL
jgi:hypothetical protein